MKNFALLFRMDILSEKSRPSEEQLQVYMQQWNKWIKKLSEENKLSGGNHFSREGKVVSSDSVNDGPHVKSKHSIAGYLIITVKSLSEAVKCAKTCPILGGKGNTVEVREIESM